MPLTNNTFRLPKKLVALPTTTWQATPHPVPEESLHARHFVEFSPANGTLMAVGLLKVAWARAWWNPLAFFCKGWRLRFCCYMVCKYTLVYIYIIYLYTSNLNHQLTVGWHSIYTVPSICPEDMDTALGFPVISGTLSTNFTWVVVSSHFNMFVKMGIFTKIVNIQKTMKPTTCSFAWLLLFYPPPFSQDD